MNDLASLFTSGPSRRVISDDLMRFVTDDDIASAKTFAGRERRVHAVCHGDRSSVHRGLCSTCCSKFFKAKREGYPPDVVIADLYQKSKLREVVRRRLIQEIKASGPSLEGYIREFLAYDPMSGALSWRKSPDHKVKTGDTAGWRNTRYLCIEVMSRHMQVHRVAWLLMTGSLPDDGIDHINGDTFDNRWSNLRPATQAQNMWNSRKPKTNTSGFKGVSYHAQSGKWRAAITVEGRRHSLGLHLTPEAAARARREAAERLHGQFARHE